jgi:hypothetical protein
MVGATALREDDMGEIERISERLARPLVAAVPNLTKSPHGVLAKNREL